jgi:hypothetical protein
VKLKVFLVVLGVLALDIVSKALTHAYFKPFEMAPHFYPFGGISIFKGFMGIDFCIHHVTNKGIAWGLAGAWQEIILIARSAIILGLAIYLRRAPHKIALALIIAGGLVTGSAGVIATGNEYQVPAEDGVTVSTRTPWVWWSTLDERTWDTLPGYPPLGPMRGRKAQECRDACPAGVLVGDGERILAYRVFGKVGAWTSFDGRSWQPLAFTGTTPSGQPGVSDVSSVFLMPMGILVHDLDGATWFGAPTA